MRKSPENPPPKRKSSWTKIAREFTNPPPKPKIMPTDKDDEKIHKSAKQKQKNKNKCRFDVLPPQVVLAAAAKLLLSLRNCLLYLQTCAKSYAAAATWTFAASNLCQQLLPCTYGSDTIPRSSRQLSICDAVTAGDSAQHRKGQLCGGKAGNPVCSERHGTVRSGSNPLALCDGVKRS